MNRKKFIEPRCVSRAVSPNAQRGFCFLHRYSMKKEIWKDIPNYEGLYQVSNLGNVKSLNYNNSGHELLLKDGLDSKGYCNVRLSKNKVAKTKRVHQLVAIAFLNHTPDGTNKLVVDHINNIKADNRLENLQILTNRENISKGKGCFLSNYKGVTWEKSRNKWKSRIRINGKLKHLGYFINELEASNAYQNKLKTL